MKHIGVNVVVMSFGFLVALLGAKNVLMNICILDQRDAGNFGLGGLIR